MKINQPITAKNTRLSEKLDEIITGKKQIPVYYEEEVELLRAAGADEDGEHFRVQQVMSAEEIADVQSEMDVDRELGK